MIRSRFASRFATIGKIIAINVAVFVLLLLLLEGVVRVAVPEVQPLGEDARLYVEHRYGPSQGYAANARGLSLDAEFVTDEHGRRIIPGEAPPAGEPAILFVGDSISVGFGVKAEDALPHLLDRRLDGYRVINAAVTTQTSRDYANVLAELLPAIRPEGIIVGLCLNDFNPDYTFELASQHGQRVRRLGEGNHSANPVPPWLSYINDHVFDFNSVLRRHSRLYVWIKDAIFDNSANVLRADYKLYLRPNAQAQISEDLSRLKELAQAHNAWIEFFAFPYEYQLRSGEHADLFPQETIKTAAGAAGISINDLYRPLADYLRASGEASKSLYLFGDPMHFSALGNKVVADLVQSGIAPRLEGTTIHARSQSAVSLPYPVYWVMAALAAIAFGYLIRGPFVLFAPRLAKIALGNRGDGRDGGESYVKRLIGNLSPWEQVPIGIEQVDLRGPLLHVNRGLCDMLGYSREELKRLSFRDITHADDLASEEKLLSQLIAGEIRSYSIEKRYLHKNGTPIPVRVTSSQVSHSGARDGYRISIIEDIARNGAAFEVLARTLEQSAAARFAALKRVLPDRWKELNGTIRNAIAESLAYRAARTRTGAALSSEPCFKPA